MLNSTLTNFNRNTSSSQLSVSSTFNVKAHYKNSPKKEARIKLDSALSRRPTENQLRMSLIYHDGLDGSNLKELENLQRQRILAKNNGLGISNNKDFEKPEKTCRKLYII